MWSLIVIGGLTSDYTLAPDQNMKGGNNDVLTAGISWWCIYFLSGEAHNVHFYGSLHKPERSYNFWFNIYAYTG